LQTLLLPHKKVLQVQSNKLSGHPVICQLLSFVPKELVKQAAEKFEADRYYKTMTTYNQLVFMLYGVITKAPSLNSLCKSLLFLDGKLSQLGITQLPASSTLSDANIVRVSAVFKELYDLLLDHYKSELKNSYFNSPVNNEAPSEKVMRFDSTTFSLFVDVLKGAGRNPNNGKKKGGIKAHCLLPFNSRVPSLVYLTEAAKNDRDFLGQLEMVKGNIYVFDKGYINYKLYADWTAKSVFFVTRMKENATYTVISEDKKIDVLETINCGGIIKDQIVELSLGYNIEGVRLRLVTYKDPLTRKILHFLTNLFDYQAGTIAQLYKCRWGIEPFFKQIKQNFEVGYFYSDSSNGIETQIWITLIANLIFTIIHQRVQEAEQFTTIVATSRANMGSFVCMISILKRSRLNQYDRNNEIIQLQIFEIQKGGVFKTKKQNPFNSS
jgi:Transposase DDE domain/Domain of unknown function (DUF4372)